MLHSDLYLIGTSLNVYIIYYFLAPRWWQQRSSWPFIPGFESKPESCSSRTAFINATFPWQSFEVVKLKILLKREPSVLVIRKILCSVMTIYWGYFPNICLYYKDIFYNHTKLFCTYKIAREIVGKQIWNSLRIFMRREIMKKLKIESISNNLFWFLIFVDISSNPVLHCYVMCVISF